MPAPEPAPGLTPGNPLPLLIAEATSELVWLHGQRRTRALKARRIELLNYLRAAEAEMYRLAWQDTPRSET